MRGPVTILVCLIATAGYALFRGLFIPLLEDILKDSDSHLAILNSDIKRTRRLRRTVPPDHRDLLCCPLSVYMEPQQCPAALQESNGRCIRVHQHQHGRYVQCSNLNTSTTIRTVISLRFWFKASSQHGYSPTHQDTPPRLPQISPSLSPWRSSPLSSCGIYQNVIKERRRKWRGW